MDQRGDEVHTSETEASGGSKEGVVRWVLVIGTLLAILLLGAIWMTGAFTQDQEDSYPSVSRQINAEQADQAATGEPIAPAIDSETATPSVAQPDAQTTPGDAPAGDPRNDAQ
jgi:hypothetical protein